MLFRSSLTPTDVPTVRPPFRLQFETAQNAWVLLYPEGMVQLNRSAGEIMCRCDGVRDVDSIVQDIEVAFDMKGLQPDVIAFLNLAHARGWLRTRPMGAA